MPPIRHKIGWKAFDPALPKRAQGSLNALGNE
jgi:hypothetical protein